MAHRRMTIHRSGRVGIGTQEPVDALMVVDADNTDNFFRTGRLGTVLRRDVSDGSRVMEVRGAGNDALLLVRGNGAVEVSGTLAVDSDPTATDHVATKGWAESQAGLGTTLTIPERGDISMGPFTQ